MPRAVPLRVEQIIVEPMQMTRITQKLDKRAKWITIIAILLVAAGETWVFIHSSGTFFPAWITTLVFAVFAYMALSMPRYMVIAHGSLEVHCMVELVKIPLGHIKRAKLLSGNDMRYCLPILGLYGIWGYYGYYLNLRNFTVFKMYAKQWRNFVLVESDDRSVVISCDQPEDFVRQIGQQ